MELNLGKKTPRWPARHGPGLRVWRRPVVCAPPPPPRKKERRRQRQQSRVQRVNYATAPLPPQQQRSAPDQCATKAPRHCIKAPQAPCQRAAAPWRWRRRRRRPPVAPAPGPRWARPRQAPARCRWPRFGGHPGRPPRPAQLRRRSASPRLRAPARRARRPRERRGRAAAAARRCSWRPPPVGCRVGARIAPSHEGWRVTRG
jgi:hypothetical protein